MNKLIQYLVTVTVLNSVLISCRSGSDVPKLEEHKSESYSNAGNSIEGKLPTVETEDSVLTAEAPPPANVPAPPPAQTAAPAPAFFPDSCLAIKTAKPDALSGAYKIYLDAQLPTRVAIDATCDMVTDGGGWTMILNYTHKGGTTPPIAVRTQNLPVMGSDILGDDESAKTLFWGHAGNLLLSKFALSKELRFFCRSSQNTRVVHFKTADAGCLSAAKTGTGSCLTVKANFTALNGHTGSIPNAPDRADTNKLDSVLTFNTFGKIVDAAPDAMWSIAADAGLNVWECDYGSDNALFDTIHRVWLR